MAIGRVDFLSLRDRCVSELFEVRFLCIGKKKKNLRVLLPACAAVISSAFLFFFFFSVHRCRMGTPLLCLLR